MKDARGRTWTREGEDCRCEDGSHLRIVPEMSDEYILSVIDGMEDVAAWAAIRAERAPLLELADRRVEDCIDRGRDPAAWRAYRVALRDLPQRFASPADVIWPEQP